MSFWFCSFFFFEKRMHLWMHKTWFFFYYFWRMHIWMNEIFHWIWILKIHVWMHEIWFFVLCSFFFNGAFMKEWNFLLNLNFEFEWKCMFEYIKFDFLYCLKNSFMNVWKFDWIWISDLSENACLSAWNLIFYSFWRMHLWMCEIFVNFMNENVLFFFF